MEGKARHSAFDKPVGKRSYTFGRVVYFCALLVYLEIAFHLLMFRSLDASIFYPILGALFVGTLAGLVSRLFSRLVNRILVIAMTFFFCVLVGAEIVYYTVFTTYFQLFGILDVAGQALDFLQIVFTAMWQRLPALIIVAGIPIALLFTVVRKFVNKERERTAWRHILTALVAAAFWLLLLLAVYQGGRGIYSAYDLYFGNLSTDAAIEKLGVINTTRLSGRNALTGNRMTSDIYVEDLAPVSTEPEPEPVVVPEPEEEVEEEEVIDTSPNILDIDFDRIIEESGNDADVTRLCEYIESQSGTNKNEYTGMFEGYNIIWMTLEGFDGYVISEELTPTLYKMTHEGFVFNNYYSPYYYGSTTGGEWSNLTGTVPNDGSYVSMSESGRRQLDMLFTAGRQASRLGYHTTGWHNNTYTYYYRDITFPNMGYTWYGSGQGYEPELNSSGDAIWPQSDVRLIEQSFPEYVDQEPFLTYYMTVSGHMGYTWDGNTMSYRHREEVEDLDYSEITKGYIAAQLELENAMTLLLQDLEDAGIADHTVIIAAPDHVPYDNMDTVDELAGETLDAIQAYKNSLIIYCPSMEEPVIVDKYCCSIDILPTVSNLMGWDYDSRMLIGSDILSDSEQFIMFPGLSYITDKVIYNAKTDEVTLLTDEEVDEEYLEAMRNKAYNWYSISDLLFATDFYSYVDEQMPEVKESGTGQDADQTFTVEDR